MLKFIVIHSNWNPGKPDDNKAGYCVRWFNFFLFFKESATFLFSVLHNNSDYFTAPTTLDVGAILFAPTKDMLPSVSFVSYKEVGLTLYYF